MKNILLQLLPVLLTMHFVSLSCTSSAQELEAPEAYFSAIIISDIDQSISWYTETFGFELVNMNDLSDRGFKQANLKLGSMALELLEINSAINQADILSNHPPKTKIQGFFKFGMKVKDFDAWVLKLEESNPSIRSAIVSDPISAKRMLILNDPDGNRIQLFEK